MTTLRIHRWKNYTRDTDICQVCKLVVSIKADDLKRLNADVVRHCPGLDKLVGVTEPPD
jgi:hypothetical protein